MMFPLSLYGVNKSFAGEYFQLPNLKVEVQPDKTKLQAEGFYDDPKGKRKLKGLNKAERANESRKRAKESRRTPVCSLLLVLEFYNNCQPSCLLVWKKYCQT
jgi:hypothetical protein